jgi:hypothetical protein
MRLISFLAVCDAMFALSEKIAKLKKSGLRNLPEG